MTLLLLACGGVPEFSDAELESIARLSPVPPPPPDPTNAFADDPDAATLGQALFFEPALSVNGQVSCATCHDPELGFSDGLALSEGLGTTSRHAPALYGNAHQRWLYWDGRADSVWSQALKPLEHPAEHGETRLGLVRTVAEDPALAQAYEAVFGALPSLEGLPEHARPVPDQPDHPHQLAWDTLSESEQDAINLAFSDLGKSLAAYQRLLEPGEAPFDRFVAGDSEALSSSAQRGLQLFIGPAGCLACHSGPLFSDLAFHNVGLGPRDWLDSSDRGRWDALAPLLADPFNGAGVYSDAPEAASLQLETLARSDDTLGAFRTPTLRNVALSPPYMHGGHLETLEEVVLHYEDIRELPVNGHREEVLLPLELSRTQVDDLVAFLDSLTGEGPPAELLKAP